MSDRRYAVETAIRLAKDHARRWAKADAISPWLVPAAQGGRDG